MHHLRWEMQPAINLFKDTEFADFCFSLDAEIKHLQAARKGTKLRHLPYKKRSCHRRDCLVTALNPQVLLDTIICMNGLNFALRSGKKRRQLRFSPPQIELVEKQGEQAYLVYREDISKIVLVDWKGVKWSQKSYTIMKTLIIPTDVLWGCTSCIWAYVQQTLPTYASTQSICYLLVFYPATWIP